MRECQGEKPVFDAVILNALFSWLLLASRLYLLLGHEKRNLILASLKITILLSLLKMLQKLNNNIIFYSICGDIVCDPIGSCIILTMHGKPHSNWVPAIVKISLKFKKYFFFSKNNLQTRYCDWLTFYSWPQD